MSVVGLYIYDAWHLTVLMPRATWMPFMSESVAEQASYFPTYNQTITIDRVRPIQSPYEA